MRHMRYSRFVALSLMLAACGDRSLAPETCGDMGMWKQPPTGQLAELNAECKGNVGCTKKTSQCGCHCSLCENESCLSWICDDSCMPTCPTARPVPGASCTAALPSCDYTIEACPCGPSDIKWHCSCAKGSWSCSRDYDCYPCMDGRRDAGPDARRDSTVDAVKNDVLKKDLPPKLDHAVCTVPSYPKDCSQVSHFDCGFMASCAGNVVQASWHEHVFCGGDGMEQIVNYSCSYTCPGSCVSATAWPQNGTDLVQQYCK